MKMILLDKKVIEENKFVIKISDLLTNSKEVEVVEIEDVKSFVEDNSFMEFCIKSGYKLIKIKE